MKILKTLFVFFVVIASTSCIKTINADHLTFNNDDILLKTLDQQCNEINKHGDILELLTEIKSDTAKALDLLNGDEPWKQQSQIEDIATSVNNNTKEVVALSEKDWVTDIWNYEANWKISSNDFEHPSTDQFGDEYKIISARAKDIFFLGEKRMDLMSKISLQVKDNDIIVHFNKRGSSLEVCQLHRTLIILFEVKYGNFISQNKRYFNLTLNF